MQSSVNAAKIVMLYFIIYFMSLIKRNIEKPEDYGSPGDTTLLELIHITIIAWSNCKNRDGVAVNRTEYWLQLLQVI